MIFHHAAIICSDYKVSKKFYTGVLGFQVVREIYREDRKSFKLDLAMDGHYLLELFSFPNPPPRPSHPESCGLRHLAFGVPNVAEKRNELLNKNILCEEIRRDEFTDKLFFFIADPDGLPLEFYEI